MNRALKITTDHDSDDGQAEREPAQPKGTTVSEHDRLLPTGGFGSFGHFLWATAKGGHHGHPGLRQAAVELKRWEDIQSKQRQIDLEAKAPQGMFEESDPDGGNLVPPKYAVDLYQRTYDQNQLLRYLSPIPIAGRRIGIPALKEDSRADGSRHGTVRGYWAYEADQYTRSSPQFRRIELLLHKLVVGVYATEEIIEDSPQALENYVTPLATAEINFQVNDAVINGGGAGKPMGLLKANSKITVAAVSGQGATTIVAQNLLSMKNRITPAFRRGMVWLFNQDAEQSLDRMYVGTGQHSATNFLSYDDGGSLRIMGSPALLIEQCATLGTEGDIIAFAPQGYACIVKQLGVESAMSTHVRFDYGESMFKFRFRMDGQVKDDVALTPYKGTQTTSAVVTLSSTRT